MAGHLVSAHGCPYYHVADEAQAIFFDEACRRSTSTITTLLIKNDAVFLFELTREGNFNSEVSLKLTTLSCLPTALMYSIQMSNGKSSNLWKSRVLMIGHPDVEELKITEDFLKSMCDNEMLRVDVETSEE
ncbi:uncharacterized protein LOC142575756 [Dermacentor variabilis]|uniref:uncharacterized protein LOC142575756 n=1 Tax=Dermacentor variabilis TaxID=34621 RepID=UPI003F5BE58B